MTWSTRMSASLAVACAAALCVGCGSDSPSNPARLAFVAGMDGYVYTVSARGGGLRRLTRGRNWGAQALAWAPDGKRLAVVSDNVPDTGRYSSSVIVMDRDGRHRRRLALLARSQAQLRWRSTGTIEVLENAWPRDTIVREVSVAHGGVGESGEEPAGVLSPDGEWRATARGDWPRRDSQIVVARADGSHAVNVSRTRSVGPAPLQEWSPSWSPDGGRIAYLVDRGRGSSIWVMKRDGSRARRVAGAQGADAGPEWSPDGRGLAYSADADDDGLDELYVVGARRGRPRKLAELEYVRDLAWQPSGRHVEPVRAPPLSPRPWKLVRTYTYEVRDGDARLADVRLLRRFASDRDRPVLADLSPDGSRVAVVRRDRLAVLDLRTSRSTVLARLRLTDEGPQALFSLDGRQLLYRESGGLVARELRSGASIRIADSLSGPFEWLRGGRAVYLDGRHGLEVVVPGRNPRPLAHLPRIDRFAIDADGRRLLYDRRCETWLLDRRTGRRRRLSGHMFVPSRAWAPSGAYFVLQRAEECTPKTGAIWAYHSSDALFSAGGTRIAVTSGRGATWSRDSRLVFVYPHATGSSVSGTQGLVAIDPRRRTASVLLDVGNAYSDAFVGPGGRVVFTKYDRPWRVSYGETSGGLYVGRLVHSAG